MSDLLKKNADNYEDEMKSRFLTFIIGKELFGLRLKNVMEIVGIQPIVKMPEMPGFIKGIINLRGKIIPVMDVRLRFQKTEKAYGDRTCIIVIEYNNVLIGMIVDSVSEVLTIPEEEIEENPEISSRGSHGYINGIGKLNEQVVLLIDCDKLLNREEFGAVSVHL